MAQTLNARRTQQRQKIYSWLDWFRGPEKKTAQPKSIEEQHKLFQEMKRLRGR